MERKMVGFKLKEEYFAFDIMSVIEIIRPKEITEVPTAPGFIEGVINLRGKIIPIIDLRKRFSLEAAGGGKKSRIIIIDLGDRQYVGVIVDEVTKVINVNDGDVMPPPATVAGSGGKYIEAVARIGEMIIVMLDIGRIFSETEQIDLNEISKAAGGQIE